MSLPDAAGAAAAWDSVEQQSEQLGRWSTRQHIVHVTNLVSDMRNAAPRAVLHYATLVLIVADQDDVRALRSAALELRESVRVQHLDIRWQDPAMLFTATLDQQQQRPPAHVLLQAVFAATAAFAPLSSVRWSLASPADPLCLYEALQQPQALLRLVLQLEPGDVPQPLRVRRLLLHVALRCTALRVLELRHDGRDAHSYDFADVLAVLADDPCAELAARLTMLRIGAGVFANLTESVLRRLPALRSLLLVECVDEPLPQSVSVLQSLALLGSSLLQLELPHAVTSCAAADALASALLHLPLLCKLDLAASRQDLSCVLTSAVTQRLPALLHLGLARCQPLDVAKLAPALLHLRDLRVLRMTAVPLAVPGAAALARVLPALPCLTRLALTTDSLAADAEAALVRALQPLAMLQHVFEPHSSAGRAAFVTDVLGHLRQLRRLFLGRDGLSSVTAQALADALPMLPALTDLAFALAGTDVDVLLAAVRAAVANKPVLRFLSLELCDAPPGDASFDVLAAVIASALRTGALPVLRHLSLRNVLSGALSSTTALCSALHARRADFAMLIVERHASVIPVWPELIAQRAYRVLLMPRLELRPGQVSGLMCARDNVPPPRLASLFELAARVVLVLDTPAHGEDVPAELHLSALRARLRCCMQCRLLFAEPMVPFAEVDRVGLIMRAMCPMCYHTVWMAQPVGDRSPNWYQYLRQ